MQMKKVLLPAVVRSMKDGTPEGRTSEYGSEFLVAAGVTLAPNSTRFSYGYRASATSQHMSNLIKRKSGCIILLKLPSKLRKQSAGGQSQSLRHVYETLLKDISP